MRTCYRGQVVIHCDILHCKVMFSHCTDLCVYVCRVVWVSILHRKAIVMINVFLQVSSASFHSSCSLTYQTVWNIMLKKTPKQTSRDDRSRSILPLENVIVEASQSTALRCSAAIQSRPINFSGKVNAVCGFNGCNVGF